MHKSISLPWHTTVLLTSVLLLAIYVLPSKESLDEIAKVSTFTKSIFPEILSPGIIGGCRIGISIIILYIAYAHASLRG